jgi:hypothetical protein
MMKATNWPPRRFWSASQQDSNTSLGRLGFFNFEKIRRPIFECSFQKEDLPMGVSTKASTKGIGLSI